MFAREKSLTASSLMLLVASIIPFEIYGRKSNLLVWLIRSRRPHWRSSRAGNLKKIPFKPLPGARA
jgi:hypothetical protein